MNASLYRRMMLDHNIMSLRRLAYHAVYSHTQPSASLGHPTASRLLMPVPLKGRTADHPKGAGGTRVFACWRRVAFGRYRLHPTGGRTATVSICVHWGWRADHPRQVSELYRQRFGIEMSYRQLNQCRARTCTRNPGVRLFLVAVALRLRNMWVWLHWQVLSGKHGGGVCCVWRC